MKKIFLTPILLGLVFSSNFSLANDINTNFQSNSELQGRCILSIDNIVTGELELITELNKTLIFPGSLSIFCSKSVAYKIAPEHQYMGNNGNGFYLLRGTGNNRDSISMSLNKGSTGGDFWLKETGEIIGVGKAEMEIYPIYARIWKSGTPKTLDPSISNDFNYDVKPDIYSVTVTVNVDY